MKRNNILSVLIAAFLASSGVAFADNNNDRNDRGHDERSGQDERGAGPNHSYHKGDRLPAAEHRQQYVVNDWRARKMSAPPKGYHWVRSGDDYVLAAVATGVITAIMLNH